MKRKFQVTDAITASIGQRFLNYLIDGLMQCVLLIVGTIFIFIISDLFGSKKAFNFFATLEHNTIGLYTVVFIVVSVYYNFFEIIFARTVGKFITQTIVVDENGEKPHYDHILIRTLCRFIPFYGLFVLINPARGIHDNLSKTYVADKRNLEEAKRNFYSVKSFESEE